ncbi:unnamed protein product [Closterium sp. NIES-54]
MHTRMHAHTVPSLESVEPCGGDTACPSSFPSRPSPPHPTSRPPRSPTYYLPPPLPRLPPTPPTTHFPHHPRQLLPPPPLCSPQLLLALRRSAPLLRLRSRLSPRRLALPARLPRRFPRCPSCCPLPARRHLCLRRPASQAH